ncbi:MAG: O-antigen ligase family protein, partial [Gemmatimonadota bacterium]
MTSWTPFLCCIALLVLTYVWRFQDLFPIIAKLQLVSLASLAALGFFMVDGHFSRLGFVSKHKLAKTAFFIMALMVGSTVFGIYVGNSFRFITEDHIKNVLLMTMILAGLRSFKDVERLTLIHVIGAAGVCIWVVRFGRMRDGRLLGMPYYDANDLGMLVVCALPFCLYFLRYGSALNRLIGLAALPVLFTAFIRTGSRGGFLGLLAIGLFFVFKFDAFTRRTRVLCFGCGVAAMAFLAGDQYWELIQTLLHPTQDYNWAGNADTGRMEVWKRGLGYMIQRPIFGVGPYNFFVAEGTLSSHAQMQQLGEGFKWSVAHNS